MLYLLVWAAFGQDGGLWDPDNDYYEYEDYAEGDDLSWVNPNPQIPYNATTMTPAEDTGPMYYDTAGWTYHDVIGLIFCAVFVALTVLWLVISTLCACCECCGWVLAPWLCGGLCACRCCPCQCCQSDVETDNPDLRRHWVKITHVDKGRKPATKDDLNVQNSEPGQRSPLPLPR